MTKKSAKSATPKTTIKKSTPKNKAVETPAKVPKDTIVVQSSMPSVAKLFVQSARIIVRDRWLFLKIGLIYGALSFLFQGEGIFSADDANGINNSSVTDTLTAFSGGSDVASGGAGGALQFVLMLLTTLTLIWSLRQIHAGHTVKAKDAFYKSSAPFVPLLLTLLVIALQLLPLFISINLYQVLIGTGIVKAGLEVLITLLVCGLLALPSIYLTTASFFAPYIVTLPDMKPIAALRSARELVYKRRTKVCLRLLALPVALVIVTSLFLIPVIVFIPTFTEVVYLLLASASLIFLHTYMYTLYWGLLNE